MNYLITMLLFAISMSNLYAQKPISKQLSKQLDDIEQLIPQRDSSNEAVSKADVAWHLDHSLKVVNRIYEAVENSDPANYTYQFSWSRLAIFAWGDFRRGVAKSPAVVVPPEMIDTEDLYAQLAAARKTLENFQTLPKNSFYKHFAFKNINRKRTIRFLEVHTNHHLKIMRDILKR